jgi:3-hydroxybenzoate 6-monooxygenase
MSDSFHSTIIVGGGIGGLAAALSIAAAGRAVCVLEQAPEFKEVGAGLQLAPNALRILDKLGALEYVKAKAFHPNRMVFLDAFSGDELKVVDLGSAFQARYGYPYIVTHRADLLEALLRKCQEHKLITLKNNIKVEKFNNLPNGHVELTTNLGSFGCEVLVGADGLHSVVRKTFSDDPLICHKYVAYRGTLPASAIEKHDYFEDVVCWIGPDLHLVQYPVRNSELYNQVAVFKSKNYSPDNDAWGGAEELEKTFSNCFGAVKKSVSYMDTSRRWPLFDREPLTEWKKDNVVLLGDAAHPMLQFLAQGACQSLEDADKLGASLVEYGSDLSLALRDYVNRRIGKATRVQQGARIFGNILHAQDPTTNLVRNALFKEIAADNYKFTDWLYFP